MPSRFQDYYNQKKQDDSSRNQRKLTSLMQYLRDKDVSGSTEARVNNSSLEVSSKKRGDPRDDYRTSAATLEAGSANSFASDKGRMRRSVCVESHKSKMPQNSGIARNDSLLKRQPSKL